VDPNGTYTPNSEKQPVVEPLLKTHCSADCKYVLFLEGEKFGGEGIKILKCNYRSDSDNDCDNLEGKKFVY
jgi:hypothetical protein